MALDYLQAPLAFADETMRAAEGLPIGAARTLKPS
jgi:hypothetical protein